MVGFFIASMISIYSPWIASIIVTDEVPLLRARRYLETGTHDGSFCGAVRTRDRRCVITDDPVRMAQAGRWRGFDLCHIFPLAYKGKCSVRNGAVRPSVLGQDEDGLHFAVPSRPRVLAVPPPGPTGAPDGWEHWENGKNLGTMVCSIPSPMNPTGTASTVWGMGYCSIAVYIVTSTPTRWL